MPGLDKTGPLGTGPNGRGMGPCGGGTAGRGRGGRGNGRGAGAGWGNRAVNLSPEDDKAMTEKEKTCLESRLEAAKNRLEELGK